MTTKVSFLVTLMACSVGLLACASDVPPADTGETSQALSSNEVEYEYYSDDTYTVQFGYLFHGCTPGSSSWGRRTRYIIGSQTSCQTNHTAGCWQFINDHYVCDYDACVNCF